MRKIDESRAANYIRKHSNYKKWLAFVLCLSLLTGTITLYTLNKPATAMTEEGAEGLGVMLETADDAYEQELIDQMNDDDEEEYGESEDSSDESSDDEEKENADDEEEYNESEDSSDESSDDEEKENADDLEDSLEKDEEAADLEDEEKDEKSLLKEKSEKTLSTDEKLAKLGVPESVDVAEYVTETIIEKKLEDGSWKRIDKEDLKEGDYIKVTFKYSIPEKAKLSEDIYLEIPEEFEKLETEVASLSGDDGTAELTASNQIKIEYDDSVKKNIIEDADIDMEDSEESSESDDEDLQASLSRKVVSFFKSLSLTVYAAGTESVTVMGMYGSTPTGDRTSNMVVDSAAVYKTDYYWQNNQLVLKPVNQLQQVHDGDIIEKNQELYFLLGFHIDRGTLSSSNKTFTYDLGQAGFSSVVPEIDRPLTDDQGHIIGSYTITADGLVTFYPNDEYIQKNASGEDLYGKFDFITKVDESQSDEHDKIEYTFNDKVKIYVYIQNKNTYNAFVNKTESSYDEATGKISYKVEITTGENGTGGSINFTDTMSVLGSDRNTADSYLTGLINATKFEDLTVKFTGVYQGSQKSDWDITPFIGNRISRNGQTVTISNLDGLEKGERYTITYSYVVPAEIRGSVKAFLNNKAEIEVENIETNPANIDHEFNNIPKISKEGKKDKEDIVWTITLNSNHANLKGYVLTDYLKTIGINGSEQHEYATEHLEYKSYDVDGKESHGHLKLTDLGNGEYGYKFDKDDTKTYVITYKTKPSLLSTYWNNDIVNHAEIKLETDGSINEQAEASYHMDGTVMEKEAESLSETGNYVNVKWKVTFHAKITPNQIDSNQSGPAKKYWYYKDTIDTTSVNQIITEQQKEEITKKFKEKLGPDSEITFTGAGTKVGDKTGYTGFEIKVYKNLDKDATVEYETTGYIGDGSSSVSFKNSGYVYTDHFGDSDEIKYYPILTKMDGSGEAFGQTEDSKHQYYSQALLEKGIMQWIICVSIPSGYKDGNLQIIEKLPENASVIDESINYVGKTYYGLEIASDIGMSQGNRELVDGTTYKGTSFGVSKNSAGNKITIDFDGNMLAGQTFFLRICASINDEFWKDGKVTVGTFTNEVTLRKKDGGDISTQHQTQTIEKTTSLIEKTGERYEVDTEAVDSYKYVLDINEGAADLIQESDTLTLIDTLHTYSALTETGSVDVDFSVSLDPEKLKVYEVDEKGNRTELDKSKYSYALDDYYTDEYTYSNNNYKVNHYSVLEFKIPDGKHLQVEYVYKFFGSKGTTIYLDNEAVLKGVAENNSSHHYEDGFKIQNDSALLWSEAVKIIKVDDTNTEKVLPGAKFKLYKYTVTGSGSEGSYQPISDKNYDCETGEDGTITLNKVIAFNTAYKLVEVETPDGYISKDVETYFLVDSSTEKLTDVKPDDFEKMGGKRYAVGTPIFVRNTPNKTSITINKIWDEAGSDSSNRPGVINVVLNRSLVPMDEQNEVVESYNIVNILRKDRNRVIKQFIGLPSVKSGSTVSFTVGGMRGQWNSELPLVEINGNQIDIADNFAVTGSGQTATITCTITGNTDIVITDTWNYVAETTYSIKEPAATSTTQTQGTVPTVDDKDFPRKEMLEGSKDSVNWTKTLYNLEKYYKAEDGKVYKWVYYIESEEVNAFYFYDADSARISSGTLTITNHRNTVEGFELPKTGGVGTLPYALVGLGLTGSAVIGEKVVRRRKKKDEDPA